MVMQPANSYRSDLILKAKKTNQNTYMFTTLFSSLPNQNTCFRHQILQHIKFIWRSRSHDENHM